MTNKLVRADAALPGTANRRFGAGFSALVVLTEVAAISLAQTSPIAGAVGLGVLACLQVITAARVGGRLGNLLLAAGSLSIAATVASGAAIWFKKDTQYLMDPPFVTHGGPLGWTLTPGASHVTKIVNGKTLFSRTYTIGADGHRTTISADEGPAIAFLGDSFTLGDGVEDAETMPQVFADLTRRRFRVVNFGVGAYSPAPVLRELELGLYDSALKPTKAIFMMTVDWQAARIACVHDSLVGAPRYASRDDGSVYLAGSCEPLPQPSMLGRLLLSTPVGQTFFTNHLRWVSDAEMQTYIDVVVSIGRLCKSKYGVPLRVLYLRNASYLVFNHLTDDTIMDRMRKGGVLVYDLTLPQEGTGAFAIPNDGHPTALAHRLHVQKLVDELNRTEPALLQDEGGNRLLLADKGEAETTAALDITGSLHPSPRLR